MWGTWAVWSCAGSWLLRPIFEGWGQQMPFTDRKAGGKKQFCRIIITSGVTDGISFFSCRWFLTKCLYMCVWQFYFQKGAAFCHCISRGRSFCIGVSAKGFWEIAHIFLTQRCISYCKPNKKVELTSLHLYHGYMSSRLIITCVDEIHFVKLSFRTTYVNITLNGLVLSCSIQILYDS